MTTYKQTQPNTPGALPDPGTVPYATPRFWDFVTAHANDDPSALRLKFHGHTELDYGLAITQIECRRKFARKLCDTLTRFDRFVFPTELSGEQCTGDLLADFHAEIVGRLDCNDAGKTIVDFTAGLGIDTMHLGRRGNSVTAIDRQPALAEALKWNSTGLGLSQLTAGQGDSVEMLQAGLISGDIAFIDPARRSADGGRTYSIADCQPDVVQLLPALGKSFRFVVIKLSPMLDLTQTARELGDKLTDLYVLGTKTECKEIVAVLDMKGAGRNKPIIHAVTVTADGHDELTFDRDEENSLPSMATGLPAVGDIVYELWPAVIKAAPFNTLAQRFGSVKKLAPNTHVFFAGSPVDAFPGEGRTVVDVIPYMSKHIKRLHNQYPKIDVATRNFDVPADALRRKLNVKPSGPLRLLAVRDAASRPYLLILR